MANWIRVASLNDCPPGQTLEVVAADRIVALFNVEGQVYAMDGICPHQGGPLGKGHLQGCVLTCPWHGWQYDVRNGQHQANKSIVHTCFAVRADESDIWVDLPT